MLLLWWCPFKIQKEKLPGLQFMTTDYLSLVLTPLRIRWTIPLNNHDSKAESDPAEWLEEMCILIYFNGNLGSERRPCCVRLTVPPNYACPQAQEAELQKLLQVHLKLPSTALWFEPPTIGKDKVRNLDSVILYIHSWFWRGNHIYQILPFTSAYFL